MKSVEHIQKQSREIDEQYSAMTQKILSFFKNEEDSSHIILEMNAFIDSLYAQYDELVKEHINTLLNASSSQEGTLNSVLDQYMNFDNQYTDRKDEEHGKE